MAEEAGLAAALGSAVGQIAAKLLSGLVEPMVEAGGAAARLFIFDKLGWTNGIIRDTLSVIETGGPDVATGMSADGVVETLHGEVWSVIKTMFIHPELADEFVMEMISEGVSNAMQYNIGGAIQSILNTWRGSYPLEPGEVNDIVGNQIDVLDDAAAFLLMAIAGASLPATQAYAVKGANTNIQSMYSAAEARIAEHMSRLESLALFFHTVAEEVATRVLVEALEEPVTKAEHIANMLRYMYERAAARLQEYLAELLILKQQKDAGIIKPDAADKLGVLVLLEAKALYDAVLEQEQVLVNAMQAVITVDLDQVINEIVALLAEVARAYVGIVNAVATAASNDLDQFHTKLSAALATLTMVRTLKGSSYEVNPPFELIKYEPEAEAPEPQATTASAQSSSSESG